MLAAAAPACAGAVSATRAAGRASAAGDPALSRALRRAADGHEPALSLWRALDDAAGRILLVGRAAAWYLDHRSIPGGGRAGRGVRPRRCVLQWACAAPLYAAGLCNAAAGSHL